MLLLRRKARGRREKASKDEGGYAKVEAEQVR